MCCSCSKAVDAQNNSLGGYFEHPQHMFKWLVGSYFLTFKTFLYLSLWKVSLISWQIRISNSRDGRIQAYPIKDLLRARFASHPHFIALFEEDKTDFFHTTYDFTFLPHYLASLNGVRYSV